VLRVRVAPRAPRSEVVGWRADGALRVRVVGGARGRDKLVRVAGLSGADVARRLGGAA
jgi:uncharacterized protein YggU (UPF0235/DUF167 family)